jgi:glycosyltransferase involved in cell wall biosynthesis
VRYIKQAIRARYGWIPAYELRNRILFGRTAVALRRVENAEVRRLSRGLPGGRFPAARVATIIPTYRRPALLLAAVESALGQSMMDQTLVVVDDCGGLPELPRDPRVHAVSLARNVGVPGVSRNIGLRLTDSPFVAFLDDDNTWRSHHLDVALARLDGADEPERPPDAVYTAMRRVTLRGDEIDRVSVPFDRRLARNRGFLDVSTFVMRRSADLRFSRLRRAKEVMPKEDWELMFRYSRRHRVEHLPDLTVDYLINPDSWWTPWEPAVVARAEQTDRD